MPTDHPVNNWNCDWRAQLCMVDISDYRSSAPGSDHRKVMFGAAVGDCRLANESSCTSASKLALLTNLANRGVLLDQPSAAALKPRTRMDCKAGGLAVIRIEDWDAVLTEAGAPAAPQPPKTLEELFPLADGKPTEPDSGESENAVSTTAKATSSAPSDTGTEISNGDEFVYGSTDKP